ncbi:MAG TPA: MFS transporter [Rhizomicrobium sp.]|nr:MFS transporter [Rhizomicrobium sp.]
MSNLAPEQTAASPIALRLSAAWGAWGLSGGIYTPFFGAWLAWKGMNPAEIGTLLSAGMLLRVIVPPVTGIIADARGDRRGVMIVLIALQFLGYLGLNWALAPAAIFLFAVTANVTGSAAGPLLDSVSTRLAERFGFDYGHVKRWNSITFAVANVLSGLAVTRWGLVVLAPWLAASLALAFAGICFLPAPPRARAPGQFGIKLRATLAEARELIGSASFALFLLAASFDQGSHAFYYGYGGLHWQQLGYSGTVIGLIWPLGVVAEAMLFSVSLQLFRAIGATRLLLLGGLGCVLRWTVLAFDPPFGFVVLVQFLHGATYALAHLGAMYFILKAVPPRLSATAQSLYAVMSNGVVMGAATFASGPLYAAYGGRTYLLMAAMGAVAMLFAWGLGRAWHGGRITQGGDDEASDAI